MNTQDKNSSVKLMFVLPQELKDILELKSQEQNVSVGSLVRTILCTSLDRTDLLTKTNPRKKYDSVQDRKEHQKIVNKERRELVKELLRKYEEEQSK